MKDANYKENNDFLTTQIITYLGNKRLLISNIENEVNTTIAALPPLPPMKPTKMAAKIPIPAKGRPSIILAPIRCPGLASSTSI
ncbi:MAG: hypothetical protein ACFNLN_12010, partial [Treponema socranskii subsp. buccale]